MKNKIIHQILHEFDAGTIPDFFDLAIYETDHEIIRHFGKFLRIGYIRKDSVTDPCNAIYINFSKIKFSITTPKNFLETKLFEDAYAQYRSTPDIYKKILQICAEIQNAKYPGK